MKLRNRNKTVLGIEKNVIREGERRFHKTFPETEAMYAHLLVDEWHSTTSNLASLILQLLQEVKNMIYNHPFPGHKVVHVEDGPWTKGRFPLGPCYEDATEKED